MTDQQLKAAVMQIHMPDSARMRLVKMLSEHVEKKKTRLVSTRKRIAVAAITACLLISLSLPALATVEPVYDLMYLIFPAAAQYFQPVQASDESNGIKMEVASIYLHDNTAEMVVTMQDLTDDRLDATADLYDSYSIRSPNDTSAHCELIGYDEAEKCASFLITISRMDGGNLEHQKITFSVKSILTQRSETAGVEVFSSISEIDTAKDTQSVYWIGGAGNDFDCSAETHSALAPDSDEKPLPVSGITLTGAAFVGEELHVQTAVHDPLKKDNRAELYLVDDSGNRVDCSYCFTFTDESGGIRTDYTEYVFSAAPENRSRYALYGDFWTSGTLIEGDWQVTFPLRQTA